MKGLGLVNKEFEELCKDCPRLKILLEEQQKSGLQKDKWLAVMRLLIDAGRISLARKFSEQSDKHDYKSDEIIDNLSLQQPDKRVRCTELECTKKDIEVRTDTNEGCFGGKKCRINEKGEIINSPANKIILTLEEKEKIGFFYNGNEDTGFYYDEMNPNIYARHIKNNYSLMYHDANRYYIYRGNSWKVFGEFKMKKVLRSFFHKFEPNLWRLSIENAYMSTLRYECYDIEELKPAENYINEKTA